MRVRVSCHVANVRGQESILEPAKFVVGREWLGVINVERRTRALSPDLLAACRRHPDRALSTVVALAAEIDVDRPRARFGAWYELFPRSWGGLPGVTEQLPRLAALGFDVVYLPPIHPIGRTLRKGRNNALVAAPDDPGSPWAIGSDGGGHTAVHPDDPSDRPLRPQRRQQHPARKEEGPRQPVGYRRGRGRARRRPPGSRHPCRLRPAGRAGGGARARDRARLRDPVLRRPSVAARASGVVSPPARRDAEVRGEPAQALPGHLQRQLRL